ncbi:MAG: hypothetical protein M1469_01075 [Bacteroidetes bacterium]|nr:hypothetical protein [Bacteroidota bacterium]
MKSILTRIAVIAICAVIVVIMLPRSCSQPTDSRVSELFTPKDSTFAPVVQKKYRPPSTPFERQKSPVKLPSDLRESDIKEAIRIIGSPRLPVPQSPSQPQGDTTVIILSRDNHIYAHGGTRSLKVERWQYLPPLLQFGVYRQIGLAVSLSPSLRVFPSPCLAVSFLQLDGRFQLPTLAADLDGVGIGAGYRIKEFTVGALCALPYALSTLHPGIKLFVTYNF